MGMIQATASLLQTIANSKISQVLVFTKIVVLNEDIMRMWENLILNHEWSRFKKY